MRENGELGAAADPETLATALLSAYQGGLLLSQVRGNLTPLRAAIDVAVASAGA